MLEASFHNLSLKINNIYFRTNNSRPWIYIDLGLCFTGIISGKSEVFPKSHKLRNTQLPNFLSSEGVLVHFVIAKICESSFCEKEKVYFSLPLEVTGSRSPIVWHLIDTGHCQCRIVTALWARKKRELRPNWNWKNQISPVNHPLMLCPQWLTFLMPSLKHIPILNQSTIDIKTSEFW